MDTLAIIRAMTKPFLDSPRVRREHERWEQQRKLKLEQEERKKLERQQEEREAECRRNPAYQKYLAEWDAYAEACKNALQQQRTQTVSVPPPHGQPPVSQPRPPPDRPQSNVMCYGPQRGPPAVASGGRANGTGRYYNDNEGQAATAERMSCTSATDPYNNMAHNNMAHNHTATHTRQYANAHASAASGYPCTNDGRVQPKRSNVGYMPMAMGHSTRLVSAQLLECGPVNMAMVDARAHANNVSGAVSNGNVVPVVDLVDDDCATVGTATRPSTVPASHQSTPTVMQQMDRGPQRGPPVSVLAPSVSHSMVNVPGCVSSASARHQTAVHTDRPAGSRDPRLHARPPAVARGGQVNGAVSKENGNVVPFVDLVDDDCATEDRPPSSNAPAGSRDPRLRARPPAVAGGGQVNGAVSNGNVVPVVDLVDDDCAAEGTATRPSTVPADHRTTPTVDIHHQSNAPMYRHKPNSTSTHSYNHHNQYNHSTRTQNPNQYTPNGYNSTQHRPSVCPGPGATVERDKAERLRKALERAAVSEAAREKHTNNTHKEPPTMNVHEILGWSAEQRAAPVKPSVGRKPMPVEQPSTVLMSASAGNNQANHSDTAQTQPRPSAAGQVPPIVQGSEPMPKLMEQTAPMPQTETPSGALSTSVCSRMDADPQQAAAAPPARVPKSILKRPLSLLQAQYTAEEAQPPSKKSSGQASDTPALDAGIDSEIAGCVQKHPAVDESVAPSNTDSGQSRPTCADAQGCQRTPSNVDNCGLPQPNQLLKLNSKQNGHGSNSNETDRDIEQLVLAQAESTSTPTDPSLNESSDSVGNMFDWLLPDSSPDRPIDSATSSQLPPATTVEDVNVNGGLTQNTEQPESEAALDLEGDEGVSEKTAGESSVQGNGGHHSEQYQEQEHQKLIDHIMQSKHCLACGPPAHRKRGKSPKKGRKRAPCECGLRQPPPRFVADNPSAVQGVPSYAHDSLPEDGSIKIDKSKLHKFGLFAAKEIPKNTYFGPVKGVEIIIKRGDKNAGGDYVWEIDKNHLIDSEDKSQGNWTRYANHARPQSTNMSTLKLDGQLYYYTKKNIAKNTELLLYYSDSYHKKLEEDGFVPVEDVEGAANTMKK